MGAGESKRTGPRNQTFVLVIGDDTARREDIARAVEGAGFNVWERQRDDRELATDEAARAVAIVFDAIDVGPVAVDVRALRLAEKFRAVPVLAVTSLGDREARSIVLAAGADDFVDAPVDRSELRNRLGNLLRRRVSTPPAPNTDGDILAARRAERELRTLYRASQLLQGPFRPLTAVLRDLAAIVAEGLESGGSSEVRFTAGTESGETSDFAWTRPSWTRDFSPSDGIDVRVDIGYHKGIGVSEVRRPKGREVEVIESIVEHLSLHLQRRRAEEGQRSAEAAIDSSITAIAFCDLDGKLVYVNRAAVALWGMDVPEDAVGRHLLEFWEDREKTLEVGRALRRTGHWMGELRGRHKQGKPLHILLTASAVTTPGGGTRLMATMQDITALKWHEARLAENVELLRAVVQSAPLVLLATDAEGQITLAEGSARATFDPNPGEPVGQSVFERYRDATGLADGMKRALSGERTTARIRLGRLTFDAVLVPTFAGTEGASAVTGVIGIALDVTEQLRLEEQLLQSQKMQAIGLLAGGVAHDFNNLLTVILAHGSLLLERAAGDDAQRRGIESVLDAARRAEGLTRQLLLFSRREVAYRHPLDVAEVVRGTTRMLSRLIGEDVKVRTRLVAGAPSILADKGQLEQVLMNLVVNARDAMPRGGSLVIEAGPTHLPGGPGPAGLPPGEYAFIRVSDTGTGMDERTRARIFEPFFTTKPPGRGTGLGLSTVYGIVERSGGHIHVESEVGVGSTFWVLFPAHRKERTEGAYGPLSEVMTSRRKVTILLVEDEGEVRRITERCLEAAGHRVLSAASAEQALRLATEHESEIELLVSDVVMPEMSGPVLAQRLRERLPGLRILFITGYTDDTALRYGVDQNRVELLSKPFTPDELVHRVSAVMAADVRPEDDLLRSWADSGRAETA